MTQNDRLSHTAAYLGAALSDPAIANYPEIMANLDNAHRLVTKALEHERAAERSHREDAA